MTPHSNDAVWTPEKQAARNQERKDAATAAKADTRSALDKFKDSQPKPPTSAAAKALAILPNLNGDTLALAAALTKGIFDKVQPSWREMPVAPAVPNMEIPDRERGFIPAELSPDNHPQLPPPQNTGTSASIYTLGYGFTANTPATDFYDITTPGANGGQDLSGNPLFPTYDSVEWGLLRFVSFGPTSPIRVSVTGGGGGYVDIPINQTVSIFARYALVNSIGRTVYVSPEQLVWTLGYTL